MHVDLEMQVQDLLVPTQLYDRMPSYYIYAGFVFTHLSIPFLQEYGSEWYYRCPRKLYDMAVTDLKEYEGQSIVIVSQVLVDEVNQGYQTLMPARVPPLYPPLSLSCPLPPCKARFHLALKPHLRSPLPRCLVGQGNSS